MTRNVGTIDRVLRAALGVLLIALGLFGTVSGLWKLLVIVVGIVMLVVSATRICPIYSIFGLRTCKV